MGVEMKIGLFVGLVAFAINAFGANHNEAEDEVWQRVVASWEDDVNETGNWPGSYVHTDVVSWGAEWPAPRGRSSIAKWTKFRDDNSDVLSHELFRHKVVVVDDTAIANYSVVMVRRDSEGKQQRSVQGIVETLVRSEGTWRYLSLTGFSIDSGDD